MEKKLTIGESDKEPQIDSNREEYFLLLFSFTLI